MQTQMLQTSYRGVVQDRARHMLPPGSAWSMFDLIPDIDGVPLQKRGGWGLGPAFAGAENLNAVAYSPFSGSEKYCVIDNLGHLWMSALGYRATVLATSPSLYWRLNETTNPTAFDSSGHGNNGTFGRPGALLGVLLNQDGAPIGDSDKAVLFAGNASSIISTDYNPFAIGSKRTFMGWSYQLSDANAVTLFAQYSPEYIQFGASLQIAPSNGTVDRNVDFTDGHLAFLTWDAAWPGINQWVFWALTIDDPGNTAELFINGVSKGSQAFSGSYNPAATSLRLGAREITNSSGASEIADPFDGYMDEFTVHESIVPSATIAAIHTATSSTWTDFGVAATTKQRPVFFNDTLIVLPDGDTFTTPKKFDSIAITDLALAGLTGVTPLRGVAYKSRLVIADETTLYFSDPLDPETYDVNSFVKATHPITGLAALPNMIAIFSAGHVERLRGTTPPSSISDGDMSLEPAFTEGCVDARSIVVYRDQMIWANLNGVHISDGAGINNLVELGGIRDYWHTLMESYTAGWMFAAGIFKGRYVLSITDATGAFVAGFMCDLATKTWSFLNNLPVSMFSESQGATAELVMAMSSHNYIGYFSPCFDPNSSSADGDGTAVEPSIEFPFFREGTGSSRWHDLFLGVDLTNGDGQSGELTFYYTETPDDTEYTQLVDDAGDPVTIGGTDGYERHRLPLRLAANGIGLKVVQVGESAKTALFDLEAIVRVREGRY